MAIDSALKRKAIGSIPFTWASNVSADGDIAAVDRAVSAGNYPLGMVIITLVNPNTGLTTGGTVVVITGSGFEAAQGAGTVTFGGVAAAAYTAWADGSITVVTPPHIAGAVDVVVTNNSGSVDTVVNGFTYTNVPVTSSTVYQSFIAIRIGLGM